MIKSMTTAIKLILGHPFLLLPAFIIAAINLALVVYLWPVFAGLIFDFAFTDLFLGTPFHILPFQLISSDPVAALSMIFLFLLSLTFGSFTSFYFAFLSQDKNPKMMKNLKLAFEKLGTSISIALFFFALTILIVIISFILTSIFEPLGDLSFIIFVLWGLLLFYLFIKLLFVVPAMAFEKVKLKEGLQKSYSFGLGKFWVSIVLLLIISVFSYIINIAGFSLVDFLLTLLQGENELLEYFIQLVMASLITGFSGILLASYYLNKK